MGGYRDRTVRIDFPELGDDCFVIIRNPLLEPFDRDAVVTPRLEDGSFDELAMHDRSTNRFAKLVVDWMLYDAEGNVLPLPSVDASVAERVPGHVYNMLMVEGAKLANPTKPRQGRTAKTGKTTT